MKTHGQHTKAWTALANGEDVDMHAVFDGYVASVDWPACSFYKEQMKAFPDAKVRVLKCHPIKNLCTHSNIPFLCPSVCQHLCKSVCYLSLYMYISRAVFRVLSLSLSLSLSLFLSLVISLSLFTSFSVSLFFTYHTL